MTAEDQITDQQAERILGDLRDHEADVKALALVIWHAEGDGFARMEWARKYAEAILASDWLAQRDAAIAAQAAAPQLTSAELQNLAPGSTPVCTECTGNGLDVALNGRVIGDCRVCKGTGR